MPHSTRVRLESLRLPIVDVDYLVRVFKYPNTRKSLYGVRHQVVEKATQILSEVLQNQIDGKVELDGKDLGLILQAAASTIEWQGDLLHFRLDDGDEQT